MAQNDGVPTNSEVEKQLKRMLAVKRLKAQPNRHMLLEYVVTKYLENQEISENIIGYKLFPSYEADRSDIVRVTATYLRQSLTDYYANEGVDDLVRIQLPPGRKYRPAVSYNPRSSPIAHQRKGQQLLQTLRYGDLVNASQEFLAAAAEQRDSVQALASYADVLLRLAFLKRFLLNDDVSAEFQHALEEAAKAAEIDPSCWYAHYVHGAARACLWQWKEARLAFDKALSLNERECRSNFWYPAFLSAIGEKHDGATQFAAHATENPENFLAQLTAGFLLYAEGDSVQARRFLEGGFWLQNDSWEMRVVCALNSLALGDLDDADSMLSPRFKTTELGNTSIQERFPGLAALLVAAQGNKTDARAILWCIHDDPHRKPEQMAMAYIAAGQMREAIAELTKACVARDPLMLWFPYWPVCRPLRAYSEFAALTERIGL